jgi:hypothetical protein
MTKTIIPRRAVSNKTWNKIIAQIGAVPDA